ncbi:MAG: thymidine phosphorylase [bacterium]|nr:thymidine phosphorylase [bacterium]
MNYTAVELIERKRDGLELSSDQIRWLISAFTSGEVTDYQMAAMAMAVYLRGLDHQELATWTDAMLHSGETLDLSGLEGPKVDKHSTGGGGDKVTIPLLPMVRACGVLAPTLTGRGLGHTGGTRDKLEAIPGLSTSLSSEQFMEVLRSHGMVYGGQSENLAPADAKLYALRDATGTVPSLPLIASSIMSKKLAEDLDGLVLDVKTGAGAFMPDPARARELAATMVGLGKAHGVRTTAFLTTMESPLGRQVGNASEIKESIAVLRGEGPGDLWEVVLALGAEMLLLADRAPDEPRARSMLTEAVRSGEALAVFEKVVEAQGGDPRVVENPSILPLAPRRAEVVAPAPGWVTGCHALTVGVAATRLGAGRERKEDSIDPGVGVTILAKPGDRVERGQALAEVAYREQSRWQSVRGLLAGAWSIGDEPPEPVPLMGERIRSSEMD